MNLKTKFNTFKPINQCHLFGHANYFNLFNDLYKKKKLPNSMILTGPKGLGKATFAYHFANFLLSENEENKYSIKDFTINKNNRSFKLINNHTHPNFYLLDSGDAIVRLSAAHRSLRHAIVCSPQLEVSWCALVAYPLLSSQLRNCALPFPLR